MDTTTILLIIALVALGLGGTFGTYWKLSQLLRQLARENMELKKKLEDLKRIEDRLHLLEELVLERNKPIEKPKPVAQKRRDIDEEYINMKIYVLYKQGKSIREIAKQLGLSKSTVHRRLKKILVAREKKMKSGTEMTLLEKPI